MGCSYDVINAKFGNKDMAKLFVEKFAEICKDDFYDDYYGEELIEGALDFLEERDGNYFFGIDDEPLFAQMLGGRQLDSLVFDFAKTYPKTEFVVWYDGTYNNCGAFNNVEYNYKDNKLIITTRDGEGGDYCGECEADFDERIYEFQKPNKDGKFVCPECGAILDLGYFEEIFEIPLVDGEWQLPKGMYVLLDGQDNDPYDMCDDLEDFDED